MKRNPNRLAAIEEKISKIENLVTALGTKLDFVIQETLTTYGKRIDRLESGFIWLGGLFIGTVVTGVITWFMLKR